MKRFGRKTEKREEKKKIDDHTYKKTSRIPLATYWYQTRIHVAPNSCHQSEQWNKDYFHCREIWHSIVNQQRKDMLIFSQWTTQTPISSHFPCWQREQKKIAVNESTYPPTQTPSQKKKERSHKAINLSIQDKKEFKNQIQRNYIIWYLALRIFSINTITSKLDINTEGERERENHGNMEKKENTGEKKVTPRRESRLEPCLISSRDAMKQNTIKVHRWY